MVLQIYKNIIYQNNLFKSYIYPILFWYRTIPYKYKYIQARLKGNNKEISFYPNIPLNYYVIYKVCHVLGYKITNNLKDYDLAIKFEDKTYSKPDSNLIEAHYKHKIINFKCINISKKNVEKIFKQVFGYGLMVNPLIYKKLIVKKSNINTAHDGSIINANEKPEEGYVYQKLVNNRIGNFVQDIRIPIFNNIIPFAYLKYRKPETRFSNINSYVNIVKIFSVLSKYECRKIIKFCETIGLDYGELDIVRDQDTKHIYIIDVNSTPAGPPNHISDKDYWNALSLLSCTFKNVFMKSDFAVKGK